MGRALAEICAGAEGAAELSSVPANSRKWTGSSHFPALKKPACSSVSAPEKREYIGGTVISTAGRMSVQCGYICYVRNDSVGAANCQSMRTPGQTQTAEQNGSGSALQKVRRPRSQYSIFAGICICYYVDTKLPTAACRKCVRPLGVKAQERGQGRGDGALVSAVGGQIWGGTCHLTGVGVGGTVARGCGLAGRNRGAGAGASWRERERRSEARASDRGPKSEFLPSYVGMGNDRNG